MRVKREVEYLILAWLRSAISASITKRTCNAVFSVVIDIDILEALSLRVLTEQYEE